MPSDNNNSSNNGLVSSVMETLKSDAKEAGKRSAARKMNKMATELLVSFLAQGKNKRQANNIRSSIAAALETPEGRAAFGVMLGFAIPELAKQLPPKYGPMLQSFAKEFRVEGMSVFSDMMMDFATGPAFQMAKSFITTELDGLMGDEPAEVEAPKVRVDTSSPARQNTESPLSLVETVTAANNRRFG